MTEEPCILPFRAAIAALATLGVLGVLTLADMLGGPDDLRSEMIAPTPALPGSLAEAARFAADTRYYLSNRYALRDQMIATASAAHLGLFGRSAYPEVLVGTDGFLFLGIEGTVPLIQGAAPLSQDAARDWQAMFRAQDDTFRAVGIPYLFVLGPSKEAIYRDHLPPWLRPEVWPPPGYRTDAMLALERAALTLPPTDLRLVLEQARDAGAGLLYHRTDTHWNERGAAIALQAALAGAGIATVLPDIAVSRTGAGGDLARMMGRQPMTSEDAPVLDRDGWRCTDADGNPLPIVTIDVVERSRFACTGDRGQDRHVVVFMDSFGVGAVPFLAANFNRVTLVWTNAPDPALARDLGADLVLNILVERRIQTADPATMLPADAPG